LVITSAIAGFRHDADEICNLLGYNTALLFLDFLTLEDGTDMFSQNVGKGLPLDAALYPRRAQISSWL
jgi:hypothetical protein